MNILIIGSGAREYSIALRISKDNNVNKLYFWPGNGATLNLGENLLAKSYEELIGLAKKLDVALTIVGPENELSNGIVDEFQKNGLSIFGPSKSASRLESSKVFMKEFLQNQNIKTAKFLNTDNLENAYKFIEELGDKIVVKADGLCAGKGVIIANNKEEAKQAAKEMLSGSSFGDAGRKIVIEEYLDGFELSFFAICDGKNFVSLPFAQDHKRLLDDDKGPNTGGMGAYAPSPLGSDELRIRVENEVVKPTLKGMQELGAPFCGVLFVGLMVVNGEPYVLEFNVRFGDPECEVLMPLIDGNLSEILYDAANGELTKIKIKDKFAVGVVMASKNYPYSSSEPAKINIKNELKDAHISFAGVQKQDDGLYATGGRVLVSVGMGDDIKQAVAKAYALCGEVEFDGQQFRKDIAYQVLK